MSYQGVPSIYNDAYNDDYNGFLPSRFVATPGPVS